MRCFQRIIGCMAFAQCQRFEAAYEGLFEHRRECGIDERLAAHETDQPRREAVAFDLVAQVRRRTTEVCEDRGCSPQSAQYVS
jgi:hypothetical protein